VQAVQCSSRSLTLRSELTFVGPLPGAALPRIRRDCGNGADAAAHPVIPRWILDFPVGAPYARGVEGVPDLSIRAVLANTYSQGGAEEPARVHRRPVSARRDGQLCRRFNARRAASHCGASSPSLDLCPGPHSHAFAEIVVTELTQLPVPSFPAGYLTSPLGHQTQFVPVAERTWPSVVGGR
jgi:hypothetical protein